MYRDRNTQYIHIPTYDRSFYARILYTRYRRLSFPNCDAIHENRRTDGVLRAHTYIHTNTHTRNGQNYVFFNIPKCLAPPRAKGRKEKKGIAI